VGRFYELFFDRLIFYVSKIYVGLENKQQQAQAPTSQHFLGAQLSFPSLLSLSPFLPSLFLLLSSSFLYSYPSSGRGLRVAGWRLSAPAGSGGTGPPTNFGAFEAEKVLLI